MIASEPVRVYLYGLGVVLIALLVSYGVIAADRVDLFVAALTAILGIPAVEAVRAKVSPVDLHAE